VAPNPREPSNPGGFYVLHADYPDLAGAVAIPGAQPGILAPYQERPQVHPVEFHLHIDPSRDRGRLFPLLMAAGMNRDAASNAALGATLARLDSAIPDLYKAHADSYKKLVANSTSIETPDKALNEAFQWAVVSIEQLKAHPVDAHSIPTDETALVAGYYASGDSARPGFGWFFGRDSLYTLYAINGYGDFALAKSELEFLIRRQREDGKIMHEYSQTAAAIDWRAFPYMYAAADSTPLFLLAVADYVRSSGDVAFLTAHRDAIEKAWAFETDPAHDTDHDGIYDNSQGTGWVESWPGGMPHQEIYLALLDQQASAAMGYIEDLLFTKGLVKDHKTAAAALRRSENLAHIINSEYWDPQKNCYAFSRNMDGSLDKTSTVYPALSWWSDASLNDTGKVYDGAANAPKASILEHPEGCLSQIAGAALNTDWGLRDVANTEPIYDGTSYHQGSVWPLFTGWAALAEYRGNQPLAGYQLLMENANLTKAQDLGAATELLSGDFFVPFGRSTSHQLWSSAMVITPILRGLFGISIDAQTRTITVNPHLPAGWERALIKNLPVGTEKVDLFFAHGMDGQQTVEIQSGSKENVKLATSITGARKTKNGIEMPRPAVDVDLRFESAIQGDRTRSARVLSESFGDHRLTLTLEGRAGSDARLGYYLRDPNTKLNVTGADPDTERIYATYPGIPAPRSMTVHFPEGEGWKTITVTLTW
jgi:glycogen debranching enzyme